MEESFTSSAFPVWRFDNNFLARLSYPAHRRPKCQKV